MLGIWLQSLAVWVWVGGYVREYGQISGKLLHTVIWIFIPEQVENPDMICLKRDALAISKKHILLFCLEAWPAPTKHWSTLFSTFKNEGLWIWKISTDTMAKPETSPPLYQLYLQLKRNNISEISWFTKERRGFFEERAGDLTRTQFCSRELKRRGGGSNWNIEESPNPCS